MEAHGGVPAAELDGGDVVVRGTVSSPFADGARNRGARSARDDDHSGVEMIQEVGILHQQGNGALLDEQTTPLSAPIEPSGEYSSPGHKARFRRDSSRIESLDYDVVENAVYRADQAKRIPLKQTRYLILKWVMSFIVGVMTAVVAFVINLSVENIAGLKFSWTFAAMSQSYILGFVCYLSINILLVTSSSYIVTYFAPAAAGSGIPEVKCYLNGVDLPGVLLFRTLIGKVVGSIGSVAGGLAVGKEGPLVHTGACIAAFLSQGGSTKFKLNTRWLREFKNDRDRRDLITCGACAGVAAAFRAPVGGVLFAIEEVASFWRPQLTWRTFFTTAIVSVTIRELMEVCKDGCGFFGSGGFIIFNIDDAQDEYWLYELLPVIILGVIGGLLGALFNFINVRLCKWRNKYLHQHRKCTRVIEAVIVATITSVFQFCLPLAFPCKKCEEGVADCPRPEDQHYGNFVNFRCKGEGEYNDLATIFFNTQDDAIRNLFSSAQVHEYSPASLMTFFAFFFLLAVVTYGISVPSGLFVPCILCGAAYGRLMGMVMTSITGNLDIKEGTYALLGAASFLAGAMRMTVSMCVILLELTNNLELLPLVMVVLLAAKAVGDVTKVLPIYDLHIKLKNIPLLELAPERFLRKLWASDAMSQHTVSFTRVEKISNIIDILQSNHHNGFPVVEECDGETNFLGIVLRTHLLVVLQKKISFISSPDECAPALNAFQYDITEFTKSISSKGIEVQDIHLTSAEYSMYIDLSQFVNPSSYTVQENMSLTKVYALFRQLGLRHLCVVPRSQEVLGVITRKDLFPEHLENKYPEMLSSMSTSFLGRSLSSSSLHSLGSMSKRKNMTSRLMPDN